MHIVYGGYIEVNLRKVVMGVLTFQDIEASSVQFIQFSCST